MWRRPPKSALFPYTPLFRSDAVPSPPPARAARSLPRTAPGPPPSALPPGAHRPGSKAGRRRSSEEHTSELQSPCNLECRLLLEKQKKQAVLDRVDHTVAYTP